MAVYVFPEPAYEHEILEFRFYKPFTPAYEIISDFLYRFVWYGNQSLFASFPFHFYKPFIQVKVRYFQVA